MNIQDILSRVTAGERLTEYQALALLRSNDLGSLGAAAHIIRKKLHPQPVVTYIIERNINYSNVCAADCDFCGFYVKPHERGRAYVLSREQFDEKLTELVRVGGRQILMQGGLHPSLPFEWYEELLS